MTDWLDEKESDYGYIRGLRHARDCRTCQERPCTNYVRVGYLKLVGEIIKLEGGHGVAPGLRGHVRSVRWRSCVEDCNHLYQSAFARALWARSSTAIQRPILRDDRQDHAAIFIPDRGVEIPNERCTPGSIRILGVLRLSVSAQSPGCSLVTWSDLAASDAVETRRSEQRTALRRAQRLWNQPGDPVFQHLHAAPEPYNEQTPRLMN